MDAANILVAVLTITAVGWLVWAELHSRRNQSSQVRQGTPEEADTDGPKEIRKSEQARPVRRRKKHRVLTTSHDVQESGT